MLLVGCAIIAAVISEAIMSRRTTPSVALRKRYAVTLQFSLALSLGLVILLFSAPMRTTGGGIDLVVSEHEIVQVEDVEQTQQLERPPPPPIAPPPVEVHDEQFNESVIIDLDMDLDLGRALAPPPPPAPPAPPAEAEPVAEPEIFVVVEQMPELIGGLSAVQSLIRYPELARRAGIEGTVHIQIVVDEEGRVHDPIVVRGIGGGCDEAAVEAVRQVRFRPGMQRGQPVKVRYGIPVRFRLRDADS